MNRFKSVILALVAAVGVVSCESEPLDDHTKNIEGEFKPILSFDVFGQRRVTDDVTVNWLSLSSFEVVAKVKDQHSLYKIDELRITYSALLLGTFSWERSEEGFDLGSSAEIKFANTSFTYATNNAPVLIRQAGFATISDINYNSRYMKGNFEYDMYPPRSFENDYPPIKISNGSFSYVNF